MTVDRTPEPMIRLEGVSKRYDDGTVAVHALDLDVPPGCAGGAGRARRAAARRRP
jgi:hypothetical protein